MRTRVFILSAAAAAALFGTQVFAATQKSAPISKFSGVDEIVFTCTTSKTFVNIPGLSRSFTVGAGAAEEAVVMLQASFSLSRDGADTAFVRLLVDNVIQGPGDQVPVQSLDDTGSTHGFNWQTRTLSPGSHTVRAQWRTDLGSSFCADARSLIVLHK